jgi:hypothetical protein
MDEDASNSRRGHLHDKSQGLLQKFSETAFFEKADHMKHKLGKFICSPAKTIPIADTCAQQDDFAI